jgi:predicted HTH domain antitoxin
VKNAALARVMRKIAQGRISRAEAARLLACSERHVNRLMREHGVRRPPGQSRGRSLQAEVRRMARELAAALFMRGGVSVERAAQRGGCSVRTIHRWVAKLKNSTKNARKTQKHDKNGAKNAKRSRK